MAHGAGVGSFISEGGCVPEEVTGHCPSGAAAPQMGGRGPRRGGGGALSKLWSQLWQPSQPCTTVHSCGITDKRLKGLKLSWKVLVTLRPCLPGSSPPKHLDGTMPGDYGFDPLGLGASPWVHYEV